ncbi:MAG: hypothetical protein ABII93_03735 [Chrysiogenia bacterium]
MKIKITMLIVLALGGWQFLQADLGNPDLQALCRVTLMDGTVIEGAVLAARGGYQRYWDVNGFYITETPVSVNSDFKLPVFLDLDFLALEPWTGHRYFANGAVGGFNYKGRQPVVYYLEDITYRQLYVKETKVSERTEPKKEGSAVVLSRTITTSNIYLLHESIPVFTEIPDGVYLIERVSENSLSYYMKLAPAKVKRIPVRAIAKFELLHKPPQAWLDAIAEKTARLEKALAKCEECEYLFPVWYHEVVRTPEQYRRLFKPWAEN